MAKFRRKARRSRRSFPVASRRRSNSSSGISAMNVLIAGVAYGLARPYAAKILPNLFTFGPVDSDNAIIAGAGFYALKKQKGFLKALGAVALGSEAGIVAARVTSNVTNIEVGNDAYNY